MKADDEFMAVLIPVVLLCAGPYLATRALGGQWGIVAAVGAAIFVAASVVAMFFLPYGQFAGTAWLTFGIFKAGYLSLVRLVTTPDDGFIPAPGTIDSLDTFVLGILWLVVVLVVLLLIVGVPLLLSFVAASYVTNHLNALRVSRGDTKTKNGPAAGGATRHTWFT